ncbi:hypothetical protein E2C01_030665 [Portunus trituberculatus]|uniref:Uncharacterized protein n=1 Tax=Portunus trituberculatus TaxID=210409 RepID=A0A5B7ERF6_PORTR|nr:hypothetical protein [Portunus trituberculatus]
MDIVIFAGILASFTILGLPWSEERGICEAFLFLVV